MLENTVKFPINAGSLLDTGGFLSNVQINAGGVYYKFYDM